MGCGLWVVLVGLWVMPWVCDLRYGFVFCGGCACMGLWVCGESLIASDGGRSIVGGGGGSLGWV